MAMLQEHAPQVAAASGDNGQLAQLVQLMLQKEAKTLNKESAEAVLREQARQDMLRITMEHVALVKRNQAACGHVKDNGRSTIGGQVHNDGMYHPLCLRCFKAFPPRRPQHEEIDTAVMV